MSNHAWYTYCTPAYSITEAHDSGPTHTVLLTDTTSNPLPYFKYCWGTAALSLPCAATYLAFSKLSNIFCECIVKAQPLLFIPCVSTCSTIATLLSYHSF